MLNIQHGIYFGDTLRYSYFDSSQMAGCLYQMDVYWFQETV